VGNSKPGGRGLGGGGAELLRPRKDLCGCLANGPHRNHGPKQAKFIDALRRIDVGGIEEDQVSI
jgi:hypothetical protein